jgi:hypothetical protein
MQVVVGDLPPLHGAEPGCAPQTKHHIPEDVQPRKQRRLLEHHQPVPSRPLHGNVIGQHLAFVG